MVVASKKLELAKRPSAEAKLEDQDCFKEDEAVKKQPEPPAPKATKTVKKRAAK